MRVINIFEGVNELSVLKTCQLAAAGALRCVKSPATRAKIQNLDKNTSMNSKLSCNAIQQLRLLLS
jgi:tRNA uridine 5-carbamoylmethylation protein Kti12